MKIQLTPAQIKFLRSCWTHGTERAKVNQVTSALNSVGFIEAKGPMVNWHKTWVLTEDGRAWIEARKTRRRRHVRS